MDCVRAQSVISEALDRSPVDAAMLAEAKDHCRECPQCGQFVRTLNAIRRAEPPRPPEDLADRIMVAVRAEAETASQVSPFEAQTHDAEPQAASDTAATERPDVLNEVATSETAQRVSFGSGRLNRRQAIAWGSAAAAVLLVVGVSTGLGLLKLAGSPGSLTETSEGPRSAAVQSAPQTADSAPAGTAAEDAGAAKAPATAETAPAGLYITFSGDVYVHQEPSTESKSQLTAVGQTSMTFDPSRPAAPRTVYASKEAGIIHIEDDSGDLQRFALVQRVYRATTYRLQSGDLTAYGTWPSIPPGIPRPEPEDNPAGTPSFALDGSDASGTPVYRRVGSDRQLGIAIAPGSPAEDPAAGNPNWTWWTP